MVAPSRVPAPVRLNLVALPTEHGGWSLLIAPLLVGLLVVPSAAGAWLCLAALMAFLSRQPLRLAILDIRRGKRYPRTGWAIRFASAYGLVAIVALLASISLAERPIWLPLGLAWAMGSFQFSFDLRFEGRSLVPELVGAAALSLLATMVSSIGGAPDRTAWLLGVFVALQAWSAVAYASARLKMGRGESVGRGWIIGVHLVGLVLAAGLGLWLLAAAYGILTARCAWGLSGRQRKVRTMFVGIQEIGYSLLHIVCLAVSIRMQSG